MASLPGAGIFNLVGGVGETVQPLLSVKGVGMKNRFHLLVLLVGATGGFPTGAHFPFGASLERDRSFLEVGGRAMRFAGQKDPFYFLDGKGEAHYSFFSLKTHSTYSWREKHHYFRLPEAALKLPTSAGLWALGRFRKLWDFEDGFWNRHLWEPVYNDDALRTQAAGLTGLFRDVNYEKGQITLFGSWFFIPHFGPHIKNVKGKLVSENPWFIPPPSGKVLGTLPVYKLPTPLLPLKNLLHPSFAVKASYRGLSAGYAFKPMNEIFLKKPSFALPLEKEMKGTYEEGYHFDIPIELVVWRHHIVSLAYRMAGGVRDKTWYSLSLGATYHHPVDGELKSSLWSPPQEELYFSVTAKAHFKDGIEKTLVYAAYTQEVERGAGDTSPTPPKEIPDFFLNSDSGNPLSFFYRDLFSFSRAVSVGLNYRALWDRDSLLELRVRLNYDLLREWFLLSVEGGVVFDRKVRFFASADALFRDHSLFFEGLQEDISGYKNPSRVFCGLSYRF